MALIKANRPPDWSLNGRIIGKQLLLSAYPPSQAPDRKSTRLNSSHTVNSYAVFCLKKKNSYAVFCLKKKTMENAPLCSMVLHLPLDDPARPNPVRLARQCLTGI